MDKFDQDQEKKIMDTLMVLSNYSINHMYHSLILPRQGGVCLLGLIQTRQYDRVWEIING